MSPSEDEARRASATLPSGEEASPGREASTRAQSTQKAGGKGKKKGKGARSLKRTAPRSDPAVLAASPPPENAPRYWVGIGSSAGGLEALRALIGALESADRLCLIIVQHLAPQHRSRMAEIIAQDTPLEVRELSDGEQPQAGAIYVTPPNADVVLEGGRFTLQHPEQKIGPRPSVDVFFRSLAAEVGESAVGIILSGTGSDGAKGVLAIKEEGGLTFCQKLETAKYDGMPRAARLTGAIDRELTPQEIAQHLSRLNKLGERNEQLEGDGGGRVGDPFQAVLSILRERSRVDFGEYKPSTLRRRIERRMAATRSDSLWDYAQLLRDDPEEVHALFQDVLISVTSFFRDEGPFAGLREALREKVAQKRAGEPLRCWVVGCATGEEAYSIAILANELMEELERPLALQVFATDIDDRALSVARRGVYNHLALEGLPPELLARYFVEHDDGYRVREHVREQIVFARHDVGRDPPFLKLDLISCRNVLIYFGTRLQARVLRVFHFALEQRGLLFLGKSETTSSSAEHFELVDKNHRVFSRSARRGHLPANFSRSESGREDRTAADRARPAREEEAGLFHAMVRAFAPDAILVDAESRVRHLYGRASQYLTFPQGEPNLALAKLVPAEVGIDVGALIHRATRSGSPAHGEQEHPFEQVGAVQSVSFSVFPVAVEGRREFVVALRIRPREVPPAPGDDAGAEHETQVPEHLERELKAVREHLQGIVEEHATATEEMQALNEELQSSNEELQSTNEELETTNEELQSANEELTTLNEELSVKSSELLSLNLRHQAVQGAISYPLLVVDAALRLVDFNPAAKSMFRLRESDRGHALNGLDGGLDMRAVSGLATRTLKSGEASHLQLRAGERDFEIKVQFYEGNPEGSGGCVVSFIENTELVRALEQVRSSGAQLSAILENTPAMVSMKDPLGTYTFVNRRFCERMGRGREEILGLTDEQLFGPAVGGALRERDFEVLRRREASRDEQALEVAGEVRWWLTSRFPLLDAKRSAVSVCAISLDITERMQRERQLQTFKTMVAGANAGVATFERSGGEDRAMFLSPDLEADLGYGARQAKGQSLEEILGKLLRGTGMQPRTVAEQMRSAAETVFTFERTEEQGVQRWYELRCAHSATEEGGQGQLLWLLFDVTDQVRADRLIRSQQDELAHFSRVAALGELTAGIAHEVNTPLTVITTKVDLLRSLAARNQLDHARVLKVAEDVARMAQNVSEVITGMRKMTGEEEGAQVHDLRTLVEEVAKTVGFRARQVGARLDLELAEDPVYVRCLPVQLMQVCTNLITNAADAVADLDERWIRLEVQAQDGWARMRITDSGSGIDPALAERIMTPFFTTKKAKKGTGLGLSISRKFAQQHGGDLRVRLDAPNTSFDLELPLAEAPATGEEA